MLRAICTVIVSPGKNGRCGVNTSRCPPLAKATLPGMRPPERPQTQNDCAVTVAGSTARSKSMLIVVSRGAVLAWRAGLTAVTASASTLPGASRSSAGSWRVRRCMAQGRSARGTCAS
jgi:hypothetical protein